MAPSNASNFNCVLQSQIQPSDQEWTYRVANIPKASLTNQLGLIKSISVVSDTDSSKQRISLQFAKNPGNRAIHCSSLDRYIAISFAKFRLQYPPVESENRETSTRSQPASPKESTDYVFRMLSTGITINEVTYHFFGHSNSQLKSKSCFLVAGSKEQIAREVDGLGDFSKIKSVAKLAKRIGLLFSSAKTATQLDPKRCQDIPDVKKVDYIFTDGCGLVSKHFAQVLVQKLDLRFRNTRYHPSVFQIKYAGYKGVLTLEPKLRGQILVQFRESMKKVKDVGDRSFAVVDYSRPYGFGYLNDEIVLLLHALGITESTLLRKQQDYLQFLSSAMKDPQTAFRFLSFVNEVGKAEKLLMDGLDSVKSTIQSQVTSEHNRMLNKRDEQRCRIMIPQSRLLFGICDPRNVLKPGQCALRVTMDHGGVPRTIIDCELLVTRNPCLHPGDLQKFKAVQHEELAHLTDCIIFPTQGHRPSADLMSGGDLDGDKFFVCWDPNLIPSTMSQAAHYNGPPEPITFRNITHEDRLAYFAGYTNASLGRVKNLYLDWARLKGPMSPECQELNHLFSRCVDGNRIKVPSHLENIPKPDTPLDDFILDVLHHDAVTFISNKQSSADLHWLPTDGLELMLNTDRIMFTEFHLFKMAAAWCSRNDLQITNYLDYFDFSQMSDEEKAWVLAQLPSEERTAKLVMNALLQSSLLSKVELASCKLDLPTVRWKCIFDSSIDRLGRFMEASGRALELFCRKLIVMRVDSRLTVAMYIPKQATKYKEEVVDDHVRLLSFPHSQEAKSIYRQIVPTKIDYRLYFDNTSFQLYHKQRRDTWIYLTRPGQDDAPYRGVEDVGDRRRIRQNTVDCEHNLDTVASFALNKFSGGLARQVGRVNRNAIKGAEIYVISNRDTRSLQILDQWLHFVDTREVLPLFEKAAKEYEEPSISRVDWSNKPDYISAVARDKLFDVFASLSTEDMYHSVFQWLIQHGQKPTLRQSFNYILNSPNTDDWRLPIASVVGTMIDFLSAAPSLAVTFAQVDDSSGLSGPAKQVMSDRSDQILRALATATNEMGILVVEPFKRVLKRITHMRLEGFINLVEHIALVVRSPEIALDLLMECLDRESPRIFSARLSVGQYLVKNCIGIAMEHIEEAVESRSTRQDLLRLKRSADSEIVKAHVRIDSHSSIRFATGDHVRLTAASLPTNSLTTEAYSMDALVERSEQGSVTFRCLHPIPAFAEDCSWSVKSCGSFVTSKTSLDALTDFITAPSQSCPIHGIILGIDTDDQRCGANEPTFARRSDLNESQNDAIFAALGGDLTCIWGPPGTGKTHTIAVLLEVFSEDPTRRILVTAPAHNAVDNVMRKYLSYAKQHGHSSRPALRVSTDIRKVGEDLRQHTCDAMLGKDLNENPAGRRKAQKQIKECRLIFTTCIGAGLGLLRTEQFDTVIIDEASQQVEPHSLVPLAKGCRKAILVGDHVQLRATVHPHSQALGFDMSLFERLYNSPNTSTRVRKVMLDTQYRMHASICAFPSSEFYENRLKTAVEDSARPLLPQTFPWPSLAPNATNKESRMFFVQCSTPEDLGNKSKSNAGQASLIRTLSKKLQHQKTPDCALPSIAVLVPYARQAELLKDLVADAVAVNSIDGFQGREADVVIFGTTRCNVHANIGFLKDMRRLNVVLTRARCACVVVGDKATLTGGDQAEEATRVWKRLLGTLTPLVVEA